MATTTNDTSYAAYRANNRWDRDKVADLCRHHRWHIEQHVWAGKAGKTDKLTYLTIVDYAQYLGNPYVKLSARDAALSSGVTSPTACKSLRRLVKDGQIDRPGMNRTWVDAITYRLPASPLLCKFDTSVGVLEGCVCVFGGVADPSLVTPSETPSHLGNLHFMGSGWETSPSYLMSGSYTEGETGDVMRLMRTEVGVLLGVTAVSVALVLGDSPLSKAEVGRRTGLSRSGVDGALRRLEMHRLALDTGRGWIVGKPVRDYDLDPNPSLLAKRIVRIEKERETHYARYLGMCDGS